MKHQKRIWFVKTVMALLLFARLSGGMKVLAQSPPIGQITNNASNMGSSNLPPPPPGFASRLDYIKSFTNENDAISAYRNGLVTRDEAATAHFLIGNTKAQDFYGKLVDQYGQPVTNAEIVGNVVMEYGWSAPEKFERYTTKTDANGLFQFTGLHGAKLGVVPSKAGYELGGHGEGRRESVAPQSSPNDRVTFTMWKLRGPEPMINKEMQLRVPYDGSPVVFSLATGKKAADGDLQVMLSRAPLKIKRGRDKYDWSVKIEILRGGLLAENDPYPNWAPENGYQTAFEASMSSNNVSWDGELIQNFYIKNKQGHYGRLYIDLSTDSMRPDTGITIRSWMNPSGSQNLEFDPKKQIR